MTDNLITTDPLDDLALEKVKNSSVILTLGILSIPLLFIGVILGFIALAMSGSALSEYQMNPERFDTKSIQHTRIGQILSIVGITLSGLIIYFYVIIEL